MHNYEQERAWYMTAAAIAVALSHKSGMSWSPERIAEQASKTATALLKHQRALFPTEPDHD